jgi:hypothetical protein
MNGDNYAVDRVGFLSLIIAEGQDRKENSGEQKRFHGATIPQTATR